VAPLGGAPEGTVVEMMTHLLDETVALQKLNREVNARTDHMIELMEKLRVHTWKGPRGANKLERKPKE